MTATTNEEPTPPPVLDLTQRQRVEALRIAHGLLTTTNFAAREPGSVEDLVDVALFILKGKHPMHAEPSDDHEHDWHFRTLQDLQVCETCGELRKAAVNWSTILGTLLLGLGGVMVLVFVAAIVIAIIREAKKPRAEAGWVICPDCGHRFHAEHQGKDAS